MRGILLSTKQRSDTIAKLVEFQRQAASADPALLTSLKKFVGCDGQQLRHWSTEAHLPTGQNLLRLQWFLHLVDYAPPSLEKLKPEIRSFAKLVAYKVLPLEEATSFLGFNRTDRLLTILLGREGTSKERLKKMAQAIAEHRDSLKRAETHWRSQLPAPSEPAKPISAEPTSTLDVVVQKLLELAEALKNLRPVLPPEDLKPENFGSLEITVPEVEQLVNKTKQALSQARSGLQLLAQLQPEQIREESVAALRTEAGALWQMYQVARSLVPKEVLEEICLSRALTRTNQTERRK